MLKIDRNQGDQSLITLPLAGLPEWPQSHTRGADFSAAACGLLKLALAGASVAGIAA